MTETKFTVKEDKKTLVIERVFPAPRSKVWTAFTTPELLAKWWGPRGWNTTIKHMEFKPGGYQHYGMKCEDPNQGEWFGKYSWGKSTYKEINPEDSFIYTDEFCDENGTPTPGMPAMDISMEFIEENGATRIVSTTIYDKAEDLEQTLAMGMKEGLTETWDRLEEFVSA